MASKGCRAWAFRGAARIHARGGSVAQDTVVAVTWLQKAAIMAWVQKVADQGNSHAVAAMTEAARIWGTPDPDRSTTRSRSAFQVPSGEYKNTKV